MDAADAPITVRPITVRETLSLTSIGINDQFIKPLNVTMESDKYICVCETASQNSVKIINMNLPKQHMSIPISADYALINPDLRTLAHKASLPGTTQDHLQIYDIVLKEKIKSYQMTEQVCFWKWITPKLLGLVTQASVYHWSVEDISEPVKIFERLQELENTDIVDYRCNPSQTHMFLIGTGNYSLERPRLVESHMQLFSVEKKASQAWEAHAASFATYKVLDNENPIHLLSFASRSINAGLATSKLHILDIGSQPGKAAFQKKESVISFPPFSDDYPVSVQISDRYGLIYVISRQGYIFVFTLGTATAVYSNHMIPKSIFLTSEASSIEGFYAINLRGQVLLATVNESTITPLVCEKVVNHFYDLLDEKKYDEAVEIAVHSPLGILRAPSTVAALKSAPVQSDQSTPEIQYFEALLSWAKLDAFESLEVAQIVMHDRKPLLEQWLDEDKLECTEELGDLVKTVDKDMALKIYTRGKAISKALSNFAEKKEFEKMLAYCKQVEYTPDYVLLLQKILQSDPEDAVKFALAMSRMEGGCPVDYNTISDHFLQRNLVQEATKFLLDVLEPNLPEHAFLQTKVLEVTFATLQNVAEAVVVSKMFSHYDRLRIAQLCEKAGLHFLALLHYEELPDIKRALVNCPSIEQESLVYFFETLSTEWALECMKELLHTNLRGNLQIVVQVAKKYSELLGVDSCIKIFEQYKSYEGLYFFLDSYLSSSEDPDIHFKYIEAAANTGKIKDVERVTRESMFYDAEKTKNFLMDVELPDPLINVCDRFGFVTDLTHYLYTSNMRRYIESYVQKVNPGNAPLVVGQLLDDGCPEDFIKGMILSVRFQLPVEPLVEECEKRNRLRLLTQFLEHLVSEGSQNVHVHNALGKIIIDSNNHPLDFLTSNPYYNARVVGKHCEKRDPILALVVYRRGLCDDEVIKCTNRHSLFKFQARYVVERMDGDLWDKVLDPKNEYRQQLIDQVSSTALPESKSSEQVIAAVTAFRTANHHNELVELLEIFLFKKSVWSPSLQTCLIMEAIKGTTSRVMDFINRLDIFYGSEVGEAAVEAQLYEEAFAIFKKFNLNVQAVNVLLENIRSIDRAVEFASCVEEDAVWSQVAKAQLREGLVSSAIESLFHADDATQYLEVIDAAKGGAVYHDLIRYLSMVKKKIKRPQVDGELIYAYAKIDRLRDIKEFIRMPNVAYLHNVGDRLYDGALYEAAKEVYAYISNWAKLAVTLVKLEQFQGAVDAAKKADCAKTWKEICFACVDAKKFNLAQICGLNIIVLVEDLVEVGEYYGKREYWTQLISLMESGLNLERANVGIFTELGVLYARYSPEKLMAYIEHFSTRLNIPMLISECRRQHRGKELVYLYIQYDDFDNAAKTVMRHYPDAWNHTQFKDIVLKVANGELCNEAVSFYLKEHRDLIDDVLKVLALRVDHTRVVDIMTKAGDLALVKHYLITVHDNDQGQGSDRKEDES